MRFLLALCLLGLGGTGPAWAQNATGAETEFIRSIFGVSIFLALLVLLVVGVFRFLLSDRARLLATIEKLLEKNTTLESDKQAMLRELIPLAKDNAEAFKDAKTTMEAIHSFVKAADARNLQFMNARTPA